MDPTKKKGDLDLSIYDDYEKLVMEPAVWKGISPSKCHMVVETPRANVVAGMKCFLGTYSSRFNRRHRLWIGLRNACSWEVAIPCQII